MSEKVYFTDLTASVEKNLFRKLEILMEKVGIREKIQKDALVAIKLHFGEKGNTAYVQPVFLKVIVDMVKNMGGKPFLTDSNTLYRGTRGESISHLQTALENGFSYATVGAPIIISGGLRGTTSSQVPILGKIYKEVGIAADIVAADALIAVTHFKAHELSGFGGALKNLGMGCSDRQGKLRQHSTVNPFVEGKKCIACGTCMEHCNYQAIELSNEIAVIQKELCTGCGQCIQVCPEEAIKIRWNESSLQMQKKMVEYVMGAMKGKEENTCFVNFLTHISPACDCYGHSDTPIVKDVGILSSEDPVAIDQASVDLVNQQPGNPDSKLKSNFEPGTDKFGDIYPGMDWSVQLSYAQELGLGTKDYKLVNV